MKRLPFCRKIEVHTDDRGILWQTYAKEFDIKRIYIIRNWKLGTIRAFHKHRKESKYYFVVQGAAKFVIIISKPVSFLLTDKDMAVLEIPPGWYHGWINLTDDTILVGMSDMSLEESLSDDYRIDPFKYGKEIWEIKHR